MSKNKKKKITEEREEVIRYVFEAVANEDYVFFGEKNNSRKSIYEVASDWLINYLRINEQR